MALPKLYEQIVWHNDTTPALNEDNLNAMSQAIEDIDDRVIEIASTVMEDVPIIEERLEALDPPIRVVKDFAGVQALTDALDKNAVDVKIKITPKQAGSGTPSPDNIRAITGSTEAKVTRTGKNLFDGTLTNGQINNSGAYSSNNARVSNADATISNRLKIKAGKYTIGAENLDYCTLLVKDASGDILYNDVNAWHSLPYTFTNPSEGYLYFTCRKSDNSNISTTQNIQVQEGSTAVFDGYTATTYTISLGDTRYLAELDVTSGELTVKGGIADYGDLNWYRSTSYTHPFFFADINGMSTTAGDVVSSCNESIASRQGSDFGQQAQNNQCCKGSITKQFFVRNDSYSGAPAFKTAMTGQKVVYPLATPATVQLTATEVALLYAYNTLWADTGDLALTYDASGVLRIANSKLDIDTFKSIVASSSDFADFKSKVAAL